MKYSKPEVVAVNSALGVIATVQENKSVHTFPDNNPLIQTLSAGAYEADE